LDFNSSDKTPIWKQETAIAVSVLAICFCMAFFDLGAYPQIWAAKGKSLLTTFLGSEKAAATGLAFYPYSEVILASIVALGGHLLIKGKPWYIYVISTVVMPLFAVGFAVLAVALTSIVIDPYSSAIWTMLVLSALSLRKILSRLSKAAYLRTVLRTAVAPNVISTLSNVAGEDPFKGKSTKLTFMSCEIRGLGDLIASLRDHPDVLLDIIKTVTEPLADEVIAAGGTLETLSPTGLRAFWNAPKTLEHHEQIACDCAISMIERLDTINDRIEHAITSAFSEHNPAATQISIGIGINTGYGIVGNFGSRARPHYSVIGEAADLAHILQTSSEMYGPAIIVAEHTRHAVQNNFAMIEVDRVSINEHNPPVVVYALSGNPVRRADPNFQNLVDQHTRLFQAYRAQNWPQARIEIEKTVEMGGIHPQLYQLFADRVDFYESLTPNPDWDGAFRPHIKGRNYLG
jgi:adenylate cyclase